MLNKLIIARIVLGLFVLGLVVGCIVIPKFGFFMLIIVGCVVFWWAVYVVAEDLFLT